MFEDTNSAQESGLSFDRRTALKIVGAAGMSGAVLSSTTTAASSDDEFDPIEATIADVISAINTEQATAEEITEKYLDRIEAYDDELNSIITPNPDAIDRAKELDREFVDSGLVGPLHGVPILLKDNYDTGDLPTSAGSVLLKDSVPPNDAFSVAQLREAGGIVLAKTNLHEFAYGGTTVSSLGGQTRNPYDLNRIPRGSSGGTAAGIGANLGILGMGSDTCSSIRGPSTVTNIVGFRPSIGSISRDGIVPLSETQDTGGPMTRTVADTAVAMDVLAGYDPADPATSRGVEKLPTGSDEDFTDYLDPNGLNGARIGAARDFFEAAPGFGEPRESDPEVIDVIDTALEDMEAMGATIIDPLELPGLFDLLLTVSVIQYEFERDLNDYLDSLDSPPIDTLSDVVEAGEYTPSVEDALKTAVEVDSENLDENVDYLRKLAKRDEVQETLLSAMAKEDLDAIVYPSEILQPPLIKNGGTENNGGGNCIISASSGFPAIAVPSGFTSDNHLPASIEFLGRPFSDPLLIKLAYAYEQGTMHRHPPKGYGSVT